MSKEKNIIAIHLGKIENICFVVMPFKPLFQTQYEKIIRPAVEETGFRCIRADEIYSKPRIVDDIWKSIRSARFIVAEMTDKNPNVFYEIGLAHAIGKPIIIMTRNEGDVPFDLKALRYLFYDTSDPFWGENLKNALKTMIENIIQEEGLSSYLDGITSLGGIVYPTNPDAQTIQKIDNKSVPEIYGVWGGSFKVNPRSYEGVINISQKNEELSGIMTITYFTEDVVTVVQESFTGRVNENSVTLTGVNYTFLRKGSATTYDLDNFDLILSSDRQAMEGKIISQKNTGVTMFTKMDNETSNST